MLTAHLMLASGDGRVARRSSVVLFDPTAQNQKLVTLFDDAATDEDAVRDVKRHLIDSGFSAAPLAILRWDDAELDLVIFGDVEIHTSTASVPMVSGAGSTSWVERRVSTAERGSETAIELWSGETADPTTNLVHGVVGCGGFRLVVEYASAESGVGASMASDAVADVPFDVPRRSVPQHELDDVLESGADQAAPLEVHNYLEDEASIANVDVPLDSEPEIHLGDGPVAPPPPAEPVPGVAATGVAATGMAAAGVAAAGVAAAGSASVFGQVEEEPTMPEVSANDPFDSSNDALDGPEPQAGVGLIEAARCENGHANPPQRATCYVCGVSLAADPSLSLIEQPAVGRIAFANGQILPLERSMQLGRKPVPPADVHPVIIDHAEVSRTHASVAIEGWSALITDLGSRNGTWVAPPNDPTPVRLAPNVPHLLEHGTVINLGSSEVSFTYLFEAE